MAPMLADSEWNRVTAARGALTRKQCPYFMPAGFARPLQPPGTGTRSLLAAGGLAPGARPSNSRVAISPNRSRNARAGTGNHDGRRMARPSTCTNCRLGNGLGALRLNGPVAAGFSIRKRMALTSSVRWIHGNHCQPLPYGPPAKRRKGNSMRGKAPPSAASTTPVRMMTRRTPIGSTAWVDCSQAIATLARKSCPGGASSFSSSSPWGP